MDGGHAVRILRRGSDGNGLDWIGSRFFLYLIHSDLVY